MQDKEELLYKNYEFYLAERTRLISAKVEASKTYDRTILTFSAGAFGLSVSFLKELAPTAQGRELLFSSWVCFAFAMALTTYSLLASQRACEDEIETLEKSYNQLIGIASTEAQEDCREKSRFGFSKDFVRSFAKMFAPSESAFGRAVVWLNRGAGMFFLAGILLFAWFAAAS